MPGTAAELGTPYSKDVPEVITLVEARRERKLAALKLKQLTKQEVDALEHLTERLRSLSKQRQGNNR